MTLFDQISEDIKAAMKARDKVRLETLRNIKKVFLEAKTAPGANDTLADADALKIISKLAKQGKETATTYSQAGRQDLADAELAQVEVLESYLPKQLSPDEIEAEVKKAVGRESRWPCHLRNCEEALSVSIGLLAYFSAKQPSQ